MNQDHTNSRLPARQDSDPALIQAENNTQAIMGFLPASDRIENNENIAIAQQEGYDPLAIKMALHARGTSPAERIRLLIFILVAATLVYFLFPLHRFFKPAPGELGPMSIGGPVLKESLTPAKIRQRPWLRTLVEMDRLYFQEGKLTEAIRLAESELGKLARSEWETWQQVYYRYWELLFDAGRVHTLKVSARAYLAAFPEDAFANYYNARAFLAAVDRIPGFTPDTRSAYREEAIDLAGQIDRACRALDARRQHPDARKEDAAALSDLYRKLRLEQARIYVLIWKLGGYEEDDHPDVLYRDKALDICDSEALANMKEAGKLKVAIYTHILDRWYWFEGRQIIQNQQKSRHELRRQLESLVRELQEAESR